jgi:membrane peptidoglycan carboxypeptidase
MARPQRAKQPAGGQKKRRRPWWQKLLIGLSILVLTLGLVGGIGFAVLWNSVKIPDPNADFLTTTTFVYYRNGKTQLGSFQVQNRISLEFDEMNPYVRDAIVAAENRTFWTDPGFDLMALARAGVGVLTNSDSAGGGSTITQQYIKVMYLTQEKTLSRKAKEVILAAKIGQALSKEEILQRYLNTVYFGRGAYGMEAASQAYFGVASKKLDLAQSAALVSIVNSPSNLDPRNGDQQAADLLERYQYTLNGLVEMGKITDAQRLEIYSELPKFPKIAQDSQLGGPKGFLLSMVQDELRTLGFTDDQIAGGGLKVVTTFDADAQDAAVASAQKIGKQAAASAGIKARNLHPAIVSLHNATGGVLALYGGSDYVENQRNWATTARPTGSTFKPYALAAALRAGWTLEDRLNGNTFTPDGDSTPVHNAGGSNYGTVNLLKATTSSINTAYVDLVQQLPEGPGQVRQAAVAAGVPDDGYFDMSNRIPLGASEISPLRQAAAYSTFANEGLRVAPHVVAEVVDANGKSVYKAEVAPVQAIDSDVAIDVSYALTKVAEDGTGSRAAALGYPVAGKTGTRYYGSGGTIKTVAAWFVGYTRQITTAVMYVAGDDGQQLPRHDLAGLHAEGDGRQGAHRVLTADRPHLDPDPHAASEPDPHRDADRERHRDPDPERDHDRAVAVADRDRDLDR